MSHLYSYSQKQEYIMHVSSSRGVDDMIIYPAGLSIVSTTGLHSPPAVMLLL